MNQVIYNILEKLYHETGRKHDAHYQQGYGVIIVPESYALHPRNVVFQASESKLHFMNMTGF